MPRTTRRPIGEPRSSSTSSGSVCTPPWQHASPRATTPGSLGAAYESLTTSASRPSLWTVFGDARVLGVDACPAGWVGIAVGPTGTQAYVEELVADLVAAAALDGPLDAVGVDIPIGLMTDAPRQADLLAAARIGGLRSSVFTTPIRAALQATDHATASAMNRERAGFGVSVQAYGLARRIFEVEQWSRSSQLLVREVHPEVSFAELAGAPLADRKNSWAGFQRRQALLAAAGLVLNGDLGL